MSEPTDPWAQDHPEPEGAVASGSADAAAVPPPPAPSAEPPAPSYPAPTPTGTPPAYGAAPAPYGQPVADPTPPAVAPGPYAPQPYVQSPQQPYGQPQPPYGQPQPPYGQPQPPYAQVPGGPGGYGVPAGGPAPATATDGVSIAGLISAFIVPPVGIVLSAIGLGRTGPTKARGRGIAVAGMVVSVVMALIWGGVGVGVYALYSKAKDIVASASASPWTPSTDDSTPADDDSATPEDSTGATEAPDVPAGGAVAFGQTVTYQDGLQVSVAAPVAYTPADSADAGSGTPMVVAVTVTNGTTAAVDLVLFDLSGTSGGQDVTPIFDVANGYDGIGPSDPLAAGATTTFSLAFAVSDLTDVTLAATPSWDYDEATFSTSAD